MQLHLVREWLDARLADESPQLRGGEIGYAYIEDFAFRQRNHGAPGLGDVS